MGVYRYLYCLRCKEYLHLGKYGHSDYEVDYKTFEEFLDRHQHYNGCTLVTLCDSAESELFCEMCEGKEYPNEVI